MRRAGADRQGTPARAGAGALLVLALLALGPAQRPDGGAESRTLGQLPATFVPNHGQWDAEIEYAAWTTGVAGGQGATGTVTLTAPAPAGGLLVALASSNPAAASVPASVTVPQGAASASFAVTTTAGTADRIVDVTASANGASRTATLTASGSGPTGTVTITRAEYKGGQLRIEATSSPAGTMTASVTSTGQLIGTLSSGRLELAWPTNPGSVTVRSTNGGQATRTVTT